MPPIAKGYNYQITLVIIRRQICNCWLRKERERKLETVAVNYRSEAIELMIQLPQPFNSKALNHKQISDI